MTYARYEQRSGLFQIIAVDDGGIERVVHECTGYAGKRGGRNNPSCESLKGYGPLPRGRYWVGRAYHHPRLGRWTFPLAQVEGETFGRSAFRIHGDNQAHDASQGCIVLPLGCRMHLAECGVSRLEVCQ